MLQDLRYGIRLLLKSPGFALVAILSLALGIGANTAIFSLADAVLLRPLPVVTKPAELAWLSRSYSYPLYQYFQEHSQTFQGLLGQNGVKLSLRAEAQARPAWGLLVTANYFSVLGVQPALGRTFLPDEDTEPGTHPVVILSHRLWQQEFGGTADVIGQRVHLNGHLFTIVGVAPRGFVGAEIGPRIDLWVPMMMQPQLLPATGIPGGSRLDRRDYSWMNVIGRLKPEISPEKGAAELNLLRDNFLGTDNSGFAKRPIRVFRVVGGIDPRDRGDFVPIAVLLFGVAGMVLLIASINLANLHMARGVLRYGEMGVRLALGATRFRLLRLILSESLLLAIAGGTLGLLLIFWFAAASQQLSRLAHQPIEFDLRIDLRVALFTALVSLTAGVLCGLLPAVQASRRDANSIIKRDARQSYHPSRLRDGFVAAQVSLSLVLLLTAGLFVRTLLHARSLHPGFAVQNRIVVPLNLDQGGLSEAAGLNFYRDVISRMESVPGVVSASIVRFIPLGPSRGASSVREKGKLKPGEEPIYIDFNSVGQQYFRTMGIPLLQGREFTAHDDANSARVVIVNQAFAKQFFPNEHPVGQRVYLGDTAGAEIIGVAANTVSRSIVENPRPMFYQPILQEYDANTTLIVQTERNPEVLIPAVRDAITALNSNLALWEVQTMQQHLGASLLLQELGAKLLSGFGLLALILAAIGIYGVLSYLVGQRTHEIGIRMALGADGNEVVRLVMSSGVRVVLMGMFVGALFALAVARLLKGFLFGVSPTDTATFVLVILLLGSVALSATYLPARRAANVEPTEALRCE